MIYRHFAHFSPRHTTRNASGQKMYICPIIKPFTCMKNRIILLLTLLLPLMAPAQTERNLTVHYFEQHPFAYSEDGTLTGIEVDIIHSFIAWAREKKGITIKATYKGYKDFKSFYTAVQIGSPNDMGAGTVTVTYDRRKEVQFSAPYLSNISVLVSAGSVPTLDKMEDMKDRFRGLTGITTKGSVHARYMEEIKTAFLPDMNIEYVESPEEIPGRISKDPKLFGYVDLITYWEYVKNHSDFIKIHRAASQEHERLSFIFPIRSDYALLFGEFFESGFGFTTTKKYKEILEKYLGHEVLTTVELD